jgi:hypothetical protein
MREVSRKRMGRGHRLGATVALAAVGLMMVGGGTPAHAAVPVVGALLAGVPGQYGTIKGRLVYGGSEAPAPKVLIEKGKAPKDPSVCAVNATIYSKSLVVDPKTKGIRHAFAYLVRPKGANPAALKALVEKTPKVTIDQKNCQFIPYAVAIHQDQTLEFKSSDPVNHNVNLKSWNAPFNSVMAPMGTFEKKFAAERRPIPMMCDIHPWMSAWIMVFDHPFFAVTGEDGTFEIKGVPAGEQKLVVWQESVGYASSGAALGMAVVVEADKTTDAGDVTLDPSKVRN